MSPEEKKKTQQYFKLQPSEMAVFKCASQIFAAYICSGKVTEENEADARAQIKKCVENHMKVNEDKMKLAKWQKNPHNVDALIEYLKLLKPRRKR